MKLRGFLEDKALAILLWTAAAVVSGFVLSGVGTPRDAVVYAELLFGAAFGVPLAVDYVRRARYWNRALRVLDDMDRKYLLSDLLSDPTFTDAQIAADIIETMARSLSNEAAENELARREYREYLERWVHEIKTPIASAQLIVHNHPGPGMREVALELGRIEAGVMQALYYARSSAVDKDYLVERITLGQLVDAALRRNSRELIAARFRIEKSDLPEVVYTDPKWLGFVLDQIILNAVKYRDGDEGILRFTASQTANGCTLFIEDNGIGIRDEDLPRVFEKGFTGTTGRQYAASTGMGLYISAQLIEKMSHSIHAEHGREGGFLVRIHFPRHEAYDDIRERSSPNLSEL